VKGKRDTLREFLAKIYAIDLRSKPVGTAEEADQAVRRACKTALNDREKNNVSLKALHRAMDLAG
jgi:hypothetical protein